MRYFKRIVRQIHLWLGLLSGLVVLILGITGCIYAFEEELQTWLYADKLYVNPTDTTRKPLEECLAAAQATLGKEMPIQRMVVPNDPERSYVFYHYTPQQNPKGPCPVRQHANGFSQSFGYNSPKPGSRISAGKTIFHQLSTR